MSARFDRVVAVDGSASSTPKRGADSIWISVADGEGRDPMNAPTRTEAFNEVATWCREPGRTLLVVDWGLGYPAGSAAAFGLDGDDAPWRRMWRHLDADVVDDDRNANNRFDVADDLNRRIRSPGPFWAAPAATATDALPVKKQPFVRVGEWREAEQRLRASRRWPKSCWQLTGAGSVASQSLLGIARLTRLHDALDAAGRRVTVWPFETGLAAPPDEADVVIAEFWPSLLAGVDELPAHWIRDAAQVDHAARYFAERDADGRLDELFSPTVDDPDAVVGEEGWVLGLE